MVKEYTPIESLGCKCQSCSIIYRIDILLSDELWQLVKPKNKSRYEGLLCGRCIIERLENLGEFSAYRLVEEK